MQAQDMLSVQVGGQQDARTRVLTLLILALTVLVEQVSHETNKRVE